MHGFATVIECEGSRARLSQGRVSRRGIAETQTVPATNQNARRNDLRADQIRWKVDPAPWTRSRGLLTLAVELLPTIDDELVADLVEQLGLAVADRDEELQTIRELQFAMLDDLHLRDVDNRRLRRRLADVRPQTRETPA